jgi:hypothetical protein
MVFAADRHDLATRLYHRAKDERIPMTRLADRLIEEGLNQLAGHCGTDCESRKHRLPQRCRADSRQARQRQNINPRPPANSVGFVVYTKGETMAVILQMTYSK